MLFSCGGIFASVLHDDESETVVVVCEATRNDLQHLVTFLYTGSVSVNSAEATDDFRSLILRLGLDIEQRSETNVPTSSSQQQQQLHFHKNPELSLQQLQHRQQQQTYYCKATKTTSLVPLQHEHQPQPVRKELTLLTQPLMPLQQQKFSFSLNSNRN